MTRPISCTRMVQQMRQADKRYFGIDMHKHYVVLAAVDRQQEVVVKPCKLHWSAFEPWVKENLAPLVPNPPQITAGEERITFEK